MTKVYKNDMMNVWLITNAQHSHLYFEYKPHINESSIIKEYIKYIKYYAIRRI